MTDHIFLFKFKMVPSFDFKTIKMMFEIKSTSIGT